MSKIRTFKVNGEVYDIPDTEVSSFLKDMPKAQEVQSFIVDKDTFDIPLTEVESFKKDMPTAKLTFEDKSEPSIGESMLVESAQKPFGTTEPTAPDNIDFKANPKRKISHSLGHSILNDATTQNAIKVTTDNFNADNSKLKTQDKQALNTVMPTMPLNVLTNRKSREVFYNTYASKQKLNVADVREYGERVTAQRVLQLAQDALSQGDLESAESLANSQLKTRSKDAKAIIANIANQYYNKGDKVNADRLAPLAQVGTGSYRQPDYTPTTYGFSGKQGFTVESNGEITPDTQPTATSKYLTDIASALRSPTDAYGKYVIDPASEMMKHGAEKLEQGYYEKVRGETLHGYSNNLYGLAEMAMGAAGIGTLGGQAFTAGLTGASEVAPEATKVALWGTNYLAPYLQEKYGWDETQAANAGLTADILTAMILHGVYTKGKGLVKGAQAVKSIKGMTPAEMDAEAVKILNSVPKEEFHKIVDESVSAFKADPEAFQAKVENNAEEISNHAQEAKDIAEGLDAHANTTDYQPIPHPESLGAIPEGYDVEYQGRKGTIDRGDDGTWYFNDNETGKAEQIPVKDKFNPQETLNDLGIQILPEVPQEQVAKAMADAERTGWVEEKGKRYFVSLGNPKIEGSFDMVFEQTPDGKLVNRFDSHPDPTFGQNRKLKIANKLLEEQGLPKRESLRAPRQSEPTSVVESAVTEPVSEAKAVQKVTADTEPTPDNSIYYHATDNDHIIAPGEEGYKKREGKNVVDQGIYFGKDKEHLTDRFGKNAIKVSLDIKNPLISDNQYIQVGSRLIDCLSLSKDDIKFLKRKGYDAVHLRLAKDGYYAKWNETIVFDKSQIKQLRVEPADPITPQVQETPSVEAAEVVQEPAAVEAAEITPTEDAIQEPKTAEVLSITQEGNRSEGSERMEPSKQGETPAAESAEQPTPIEEEVVDQQEFSQEEIDKAMGEREAELKTNERVSEPTKTRERSPESKAAKEQLGEIKKATKELADFLRKGKINRPDSFATNTPGSIVWDAAIEIAAKTIEAGGDVAQAVSDAIKHLKESDWYKGLEQSRKVKAEQDLTSYIKQEPQEQFPLGIKNASSRAENAYLGIEPNTELTAEQKRDVKTVQENAKRYVEQGGDPEVLINKTIQERSQLNAEELSVILDHKIKLGNDIKSLSDKLIDAYANGDSSAPAMEEKLQDLTNRFEKANEALEISGYEQGLAFRMRQIMKNNDYSLAESERKWKVASQGKEMPIEVREKFADIENKLNESQKRLDALEKANQRLKSERAVQNIEAKVGKAGDKLRALAAKIESGRVSKLQGFRSSSGFDLAWDASLKVIAESLKGGAELADAIEKGLAYIRNTDWYKNLQDKKDFEQKYEDHLNKEFTKAEYESAHYDDKGKLRISKELIKDIVRDGVESPDDLAEKIHAIVKEDLPDVSVREVKEAITEYGKTINQSKDALEAEVRRLKREGRLELGLEDAEQGKGVKRSGLLREKPTDRERELKRKINEELKKHPEDQADIDRKWKSALDRIKTGLENSIRDITKRIDDIQNGVAEPKVEKKAIPLDAEAEALKAQKKILQDQLADLEGEQGMSDEQRINLAMNNAKKAMEEYQRRIDEINATGSYSEKAKRPMPESPELDALNAEKERLKQEYENALENHGIDNIRATEQALKRKQQQIDAIVNKINSKDISFLKKKPSKVDPNNPELKLANTQLEQAKAMLNKMREEEGLINQRKLELYRKRIADRTTALEQEIASLKNGTWKEKVKPEELSLDRDILVERAKMDALKFDRDKLVEEERLKNRSWKEKVYEGIQDVMNIPKSLLSTLDLSAILRQGFVLGASHPKIALRASREMMNHMTSEKFHEDWMHQFRQTPEYRVAKDAGLYLTEPNAKLSAKEENYGSNFVHKAWGLGKVVKGSERAYTGYLNKLRVDVFGDFVDAINQTDMTPTEKKENLKAYADFVNNATGRGKLGRFEAAAPLLNVGLFAPRYVASRVNLLARAATGFQGMPPAARLRAIKDFGIYLGVVSTSLALAKAAGAEVETDPRSSDFGKIKVGNTRYDMLAGFQQPAVFMTKFLRGEVKKPSGEIEQLGEKYNSKTRKDIAEKFLRSKMSPQAGLAYDWSQGTFFDGSKFNWEDAALNSAAPLIVQDMAKMYKTEGAKGIAKTVPSIFGIGVQQQPEIMNKVLALYPVKPNIQEKLDKIKYSPDNYSDNTLYKGTEEFKITPEQVAQIADLRAKYASEAIDKAFKGRYVLKIGKNDTETYSNLSKMDDDELKAELNSIYKLATQKAKNIVLGEDNWNDKAIED